MGGGTSVVWSGHQGSLRRVAPQLLRVGASDSFLELRRVCYCFVPRDSPAKILQIPVSSQVSQSQSVRFRFLNVLYTLFPYVSSDLHSKYPHFSVSLLLSLCLLGKGRVRVFIVALSRWG